MTKRTVLNLNNTSYKEGGYPTFLGQSLGFNDNIHVTYQDIKDMHLLQRSQFWTETEVDLSRDRNDLNSAEDGQKEVMLHTLMTQWALDATASRSIIQTFGSFITNTEVLDLLMWQSEMECIHSLQYSEILRVCYDNPTEMMESAANNAAVIYRTEIIGEVFNETNKVAAKVELGILNLDNPDDKRLVQIQLLKNLAVLYGLEAISFMASFACTFALTGTGKFQGIDKAVGLICKDEVLHAEGDRLIYKHFKREVGDTVFNEAKPQMQLIFDKIVEQELAWSEYIFSEGRNVLGLNEKNLKDYVYYIAKPCIDYLGLEWKHPIVEKNPLPYMNKYTDPDSVNVAPQELEITSYRVGTVNSEMPDEFEF